MNKLNKYVVTTLLLITTTFSYAQKGDVLITATSVGNDINIAFELLNEGNISALQFDIAFTGSEAKRLSVGSCTSSMGKSKLSGCSLNDNVLRVALMNGSLGELNSGKLGMVTVNNVRGVLEKELVVSNVLIVDAKGNEKKIEATVDYENINFSSLKNELNMLK